MVALLEHRLLGDLPVGRIGEPRHELVVLGLGLRLFLLEAVEDDARVAHPLEPREAALDFPRIGRASRREPDALGPSGGVVVLLVGEAQQDAAAVLVVLALGEQPVRGGGLDFAAPHLLDGREVLRIHL